MIWLAFLIATWAVYGSGKQIGHDARVGLRNAQQRAAARSAKIRADKRAPKWKRRTVTAAHYTGKVTGATARGVRYIGASAATGARWGIGEGRKRYEEREELRQAIPLSDSDAEQRAHYRQVRDRVLHDRAERMGRPGVPARKARRIARRDAAEDERLSTEQSDPPAPEPEQQPEQPEEPDDGEPAPPVAADDPSTPIDADHDTTTPSNGGTMTAPTNGFRASGEATTISGARAAWASFEGHAVESFDTAGQAEQEAKERLAGAAQMLDAATAAETDAKQQMTAAETLAASLADADMRDPQAIDDAEQQQEHASQLADAAAQLRAEAEQIQASAAHQMELAQSLRSLAEVSQSHCAASLTGLNQRNARTEAFYKD